MVEWAVEGEGVGDEVWVFPHGPQTFCTHCANGEPRGKRECGCPVEAGPLAELFGPDMGSCPEHRAALALYNHAYFAMAGNVWSKMALVEEGLIPGVRPTMGDIDRAATVLYARLSPEQRETDRKELEAY